MVRGFVDLEARKMAEQNAAALKSHEDLCGERYKAIADKQDIATSARAAQHIENQQAIAGIGGRVDRLYNRAWAVTIALLVGMAGITIGFIAWFMHFAMTSLIAAASGTPTP